jgi:hypothetical protein
MFSGFQEILLIGLIVLGILFLPRLLDRRHHPPKDSDTNNRSRVRLTGFMRLAIFVSLGWLVAMAVYFEPWDRPDQKYIIVGTGPVLLFWGLYWIIIGFKKYRK